MDLDYVSYMEKKRQADREIREKFIKETGDLLRELGIGYTLKNVKRFYNRHLNEYVYTIVDEQENNSTN